MTLSVDMDGAAPVFGEWFTGIYASDENPHKHGMFVRIIRRTGRMNPGVCYELTDGQGAFWEYPVENIVRGGHDEACASCAGPNKCDCGWSAVVHARRPPHPRSAR